MRFHHSTRRGRNRLASSRLAYNHPTSTSRWSQLGFCRETCIIFNRRLPIEPPARANSPLRAQAELVSVEETSSPASPSSMPIASQQQERKKSSRSSRRAEELNLKNQLEDLKLNNNNKQASLTRKPAQLDMDFVRERLIAQVDKHPFWSNKAAHRMQFTSCQERNVYIYELTSYCERRELEWRFESYRGGGIVSTMPAFRRRLSDSGLGVSLAGSCSPSSLLQQEPTTTTQTTTPTRTFNKPLVVPEPTSSSTGSAKSKSRWSASSARKARRDNDLLKNEQLSGAFNELANQEKEEEASNLTQQQSSQANQSVAKSMERFIPSAEEVWAVEVPVGHQPELFTSYVYTCEYPQSSFVKRCHGCQGRGRLKCATCHGIGYEVCLGCSGKGTHKSAHHSSSSLQPFSSPFHSSSGRNSSRADNSSSYYGEENNCSTSANTDSKRSYGEPGGISGGSGGGLLTSSWAMESCHFCHGLGQKRCWTCAGRAYNHCSACLGTGQLRCFLKLIVTWINHREESLLNNSDNIIPKERLRLCSGLVLVEQVADRLSPLARQWIDGATGRVDGSNQLHQASRKLLEKQRSNLLQERLIKQRHKVTKIECHLVNYEWKARRGHFVIYGDERKVYIAKYPFKSICNIT